MKYMRKLIPVLTAALLCGCSNNDASSAPESVSTSETTSATSENSSEITSSVPEQNDDIESGIAPDYPGITDITSADPGGVDLVSEAYSENNNIFALNGKYCDISELPFSVETIQPELGDISPRCVNACGEKLILCGRYHPQTYDEAMKYGDDLPWKLYTYDLRTGELKEAFDSSGSDANHASLIYADDICLVAQSTDPEKGRVYSVINHDIGDTVLTVPGLSGNITYFSSNSMISNNCFLYFDGLYNAPEFGKDIPFILKADLTNGKTDMYYAGLRFPCYGVGNVCFEIYKPGSTDYMNLMGEVFSAYDSKKDVNTVFRDTYYPIVLQRSSDKILGDRYNISWTGKDDNSYEIGTTGFNYCADGGHITKDGIYLLPLSHNTGGSQRWALVGCCDMDYGTNYAALTSFSSNEVIFAESKTLYIVNPDTLETTVISPYIPE